MSEFKFSLGQQARITVSGETGEVTGRSEYTTLENTYYLRYKSADGRAVQAWWDESSLSTTGFDLNCEECHGTGIARIAYSSGHGPCPLCNAARPSSTVSATTDASVGSADGSDKSIK